MRRVIHQFSLFGYKEMKPKLKVPLSAERVKEAKKLLENGDYKTAAEKLRQMREGLEAFEQRLNNRRS